MHVLVIGSGGREHALAVTLKKSRCVTQVFVAPGNGGTAQTPGVTNIPIEATDIDKLLEFAQTSHIALTVIGPEAPLVAGIVDRFEAAGLRCLGPSQACAQLEGSKAFCKNFLLQHQIPTAAYAVYENVEDAVKFLASASFPQVIKADGLAAGKGVVIATDFAHAKQTLEDFLTHDRLGKAGHRVVIEDFLKGRELSYIVLTDGEYVLPLSTAQDHKRRDNQDQGPNTGGMGAFSPADNVDSELESIILSTIIEPTLSALRQQGTPYKGFLYAGLMIDEHNKPFVLEFNCRLGDPETQPILMRLESDFFEHCLAACEHRLPTQRFNWDPRPAVGVVMAAGGYPETYHTGDEIKGLTPFEHDSDVCVFEAGTEFKNGHTYTKGGRVLCVTALGKTKAQAAQKAYDRLKTIHFKNGFYRTDIGL